LAAFEFVMPGLVPGIHVLSSLKQERRGWPGQARPLKKAVRRALSRHTPHRRVIQYSETSVMESKSRGVLDTRMRGV
jgi:hypothetical protein